MLGVPKRSTQMSKDQKQRELGREKELLSWVKMTGRKSVVVTGPHSKMKKILFVSRKIEYLVLPDHPSKISGWKED